MCLAMELKDHFVVSHLLQTLFPGCHNFTFSPSEEASGKMCHKVRRGKANAALPISSLGCPIQCGFSTRTWVHPEPCPTLAVAISMCNEPRDISCEHRLPGAAELSKSNVMMVNISEEGEGTQLQRNYKHVLVQKKPAFEWCYLKEHGSNNSEKEEGFRELLRQALQTFITQEREQTFHQKEKQSAKDL